MLNELTLIASVAVSFAACALMYRIFGKPGLIAWAAFAIITANLETLKLTTLFGVETSLGTVLFATVYLTLDLMTEVYGKNEARRMIALGFSAFLVFTVLTQIDLIYSPGPTDWASPAFDQLFALVPRAFIGSVGSYLIGSHLDVWIWRRLQERDGESRMWLRANVSKAAVQLLDNVVLFAVLYGGVLPWGAVLSIILSTWVLEMALSACATPVLYRMRSMTRAEVAE